MSPDDARPAAVGGPVGQFEACRLAGQHLAASLQARLDAPAGFEVLSQAADLDLEPEVARRGHRRPDPPSRPHRRGTAAGGVEVDRARQATVPPLVLVLDEGGVGPLDDLQSERVGALRSSVALTSNSEARCESLPIPTGAPLSVTMSTDSAAPTWRTTRRPSPLGRELELALVDARGVVAGHVTEARPRRASARWCSAAGRPCPASSSSRARRSRAMAGQASHPVVTAAGTATCRPAAAQARVAGRAWAPGPAPPISGSSHGWVIRRSSSRRRPGRRG